MVHPVIDQGVREEALDPQEASSLRPLLALARQTS